MHIINICFLILVFNVISQCNDFREISMYVFYFFALKNKMHLSVLFEENVKWKIVSKS